MIEQTILLVEDNATDEGLTLRSLKRGNIMNKVVVARDGPEALDYVFARGVHAGHDSREEPQIVLPVDGGLAQLGNAHDGVQGLQLWLGLRGCLGQDVLLAPNRSSSITCHQG